MKNCVETAWILAEIEPCSFESMRNNSDSEEDNVYESQDGHPKRKLNTLWCVCKCCKIAN